MKNKYTAGTIIDNWLYFSEISCNGLFRLNLENYSMEFVDFFKDEDTYSCFLHRKVIRIDDELVFIPQYSRKIHIYNVKTKAQHSIELNDYNIKTPLLGGVSTDEGVILFPFLRGERIFCMDIKQKKLYRDHRFEKSLARYDTIKEEKLFRRLAIKNGKAYVAPYGTNIICEIDFVCGLIIEYKTNIKHIQSVFPDKEGLWVTETNSGCIWRWNGKGEEHRYETGDTGENLYSHIINDKLGNTYVLPAKGESILKLHDDKFEKLQYPIEFSFDEKYSYKFVGCAVVDDRVIVFPYKGNSILNIHGENVDYLGVNFEMAEYMKAIVQQRKGIFFENSAISLKDIIQML